MKTGIREKISHFVLFFLIVFAGTAFLAVPGRAQDRSQGISIHMLPRRVAELGGMKWGLSVDPSPRLKAESTRVVLQSAADLIAYDRKQDASVQQNGIWIVITDPAAYSEQETSLLESVKSRCRKERIPLFICRAADLPNGWMRFDQ
jgi:hypothetical protein